MHSVRYTAILLLSAVPLLFFQVFAGEVQIPTADDFYADAQASAKLKHPIVLLISQEHCPYCVQIKREILHPIIMADDYQGEIMMRELFLDLNHSVSGFQGGRHSSAAIARSYGVDLTPTLLFLGPNGEELSERIVGYYTPEFFFHYVDQAILESISKLKKR